MIPNLFSVPIKPAICAHTERKRVSCQSVQSWIFPMIGVLSAHSNAHSSRACVFHCYPKGQLVNGSFFHGVVNHCCLPFGITGVCYLSLVPAEDKRAVAEVLSKGFVNLLNLML